MAGDRRCASGSLLLTEEEWEARRKQREQGQGSGDNGNDRKNGKPKNKTGNGRNGSGNGNAGNGQRDMSWVKCYNCNHMGHFSKQKERKGRANLVQGQEEEQALLIASLDSLNVVCPSARSDPRLRR